MLNSVQYAAWGMDVQARRDIARTVEDRHQVTNRKLYMPRRLAQKRMTLSDLECLTPTYPHCVLSKLVVIV